MNSGTIEAVKMGEPEAARTGASGRVHLAALDGLRGVAALYVAFGHAFLAYRVETVRVGLPDSGAEKVLGTVLNYSKAAVALFIVLSGFCLMAPVARKGAEAGWPLGSVGGYLYRRARRILPPYYAALGLSLLAIWILPELSVAETKDWGAKFWGNLSLPAFTPEVLITHVLMIFNLRGDWIFKINSPFWSVATEWQIYFLFPLLFLPLLRAGGRWGLLVLVPLAFLAGFVPYVLLRRGNWSITDAHPWYTGLFAMGMTAAVAAISPRLGAVGGMLRRFAGRLALAAAAAAVAIAAFTDWRHRYEFIFDGICGAAVMGALVFMTRGCLDSRADSALARQCRRWLGAAPLKVLGDMSYSLYLTHVPVVVFVHHWTARQGWHTSGWGVIGIMLGIAVPLSVVIAAGFHLVFERPFMGRGKARMARAAGSLEVAGT
jgi:peptidoglycan/LPS O-acetylase OafA/YrhL